MKSLVQFILSSSRNEYVKYGSLRAYMRKEFKSINGQDFLVLTRANTSVYPNERNKGCYRNFDTLCQEKATKYGFHAVYVENVLNDILLDVLPRYGYSKVQNNYDFGGPPCFYKICRPVFFKDAKYYNTIETSEMWGDGFPTLNEVNLFKPLSRFSRLLSPYHFAEDTAAIIRENRRKRKI